MKRTIIVFSYSICFSHYKQRLRIDFEHLFYSATGAYTHSNRLELSTKVAVLPPILLNLLRRIVASGQLPWPYPPPVPQAKASADDEVSNAHASGNSSVESQPNVDKSAENSGGSHASASDASSAAADSSFEGVSSWCCTVNCYSPGQWIPPHIDNPKVCLFLVVSYLRLLLIAFDDVFR